MFNIEEYLDSDLPFGKMSMTALKQLILVFLKNEFLSDFDLAEVLRRQAINRRPEIYKKIHYQLSDKER